MTVRSGFPILSTRDLPALVAFYERAFGGVVEYRFEHDGADVYVSVAVGGATLGIAADPATPAPAAVDRMALWLYVDDVQAVFEAAVRNGAAVESAPADMPWGERVARIRDPHGTLISLGQQA